MKEKTMPRQQTNKHQTVVFDFFSGFWFIFCVFRKISFNIQFFSNDGRKKNLGGLVVNWIQRYKAP